MSEEVKKTTSWFGWAKNLISAIAGAVISCAATIGIIGTDDAAIAKEKVNGWLDKTETAYVQIDTAKTSIQEAIQLVKDGKYLEAIAKLSTIKDNATTTITVVKELKEEIGEAAKQISTEVKEKAAEVKETVKEEAEKVKEAYDDKPNKEEPAPETK